MSDIVRKATVIRSANGHVLFWQVKVRMYESLEVNLERLEYILEECNQVIADPDADTVPDKERGTVMLMRNELFGSDLCDADVAMLNHKGLTLIYEF